MTWRDDVRTTGTALKDWFVAQCCDAVAVAILWLAGLLIIGIPWAPLWGLLAGLLLIFPHLRGPAAVIIPANFGATNPHQQRLFFFFCPFFAGRCVYVFFFLS